MSIDNATPEDWDEIQKDYDREYTLDKMVEDNQKQGQYDGRATTISEWANIEALKDEAARAQAMAKDSVNPAHYYANGMEAIEAIKGMLTKEEYRGYLRGTALKYLWRSPYKGNHSEDMGKAKWFLDKLAELDDGK